MEHHEIDREAISKYSGRGEVKIIRNILGQRRADEKHRSGRGNKQKLFMSGKEVRADGVPTGDSGTGGGSGKV